MTTTSEERTRLRDIALAATQGQWKASGAGISSTEGPSMPLIALVQGGTPQAGNVSYIAAFSPGVTQGLLDEIESLEQQHLVDVELLSKAITHAEEADTALLLLQQERNEAIAKGERSEKAAAALARKAAELAEKKEPSKLAEKTVAEESKRGWFSR